MKKILIIMVLLLTLPVQAKPNKIIDVQKNTEIATQTNTESSMQDVLNGLTEYIESANKTSIPNIDLSKAYFLRGYLYQKEYNNEELALKDYNSAIKFYPENSKALFGASRIKFRFEDYTGSIEDLKKYIKLNPKDEQSRILLALLYEHIDKYDLAIAELTESIKIKNKNPEAFYWRGLYECKTNKTDKGLQDLEYAKRQYYMQNDIENYKKTSKLIQELTNMKKAKNINNTHYIPVRTIYYSNDTAVDDSATRKQLNEINETLKSIDRSIYLHY